MPEPLFTVVRGFLDPFETAALAVVLATAATRAAPGSGESSAAAAAGPWRPAAAGFQPAGSWRRRR